MGTTILIYAIVFYLVGILPAWLLARKMARDIDELKSYSLLSWYAFFSLIIIYIYMKAEEYEREMNKRNKE